MLWHTQGSQDQEDARWLASGDELDDDQELDEDELDADWMEDSPFDEDDLDAPWGDELDSLLIDPDLTDDL